MKLFPVGRFSAALWAFSSLTCVAFQAPQDWQAVRSQEIAQCLEGEISTWGDNRDRPAAQRHLVFAYRHSGAPAWFDTSTVVGTLIRSAQAWSQCQVTASVSILDPADATPHNAILVQWSNTDSHRNFGLANIGLNTLSIGPEAFQVLNKRNPTHDARTTLQMVISHEMGHFFGVMDHSKRCVDVTSYYHNGKGEQCNIRDGGVMPKSTEYRSLLPTACDIQRCKAANRIPL
jgi:hypothetical protein